jgi:multicomponent Na+:H+ antiporter subunit D
MAVAGFFTAMRSRVDLNSLTGMGHRMPITATAFVICGLSLIGLPLTAGFISKLYLVRAMLETDSYLLVGIVLASSALSVIYLWKIIEVMWMQPAAQDAPKLDENPAVYMPLWMLAGLNLWFGIDAGWMVASADAAAKALIGAGL